MPQGAASPAAPPADANGVADALLQLVTSRYNPAGDSQPPAPAGGAQVPAVKGPAANPADVMHRLTVQQVRTIELLVGGSSDGSAARVVGVHRVTVTRWRLYHLHFRAELNRRRQEVWGAAADRVRGLLGTAVEVVAGQLASRDPVVQFRAAKALLALAGAGRFAPPDEAADPWGLLDDLARKKHAERRADETGKRPDHESVGHEDRLAALEDLGQARRALLGPAEPAAEGEAAEGVKANQAGDGGGGKALPGRVRTDVDAASTGRSGG